MILITIRVRVKIWNVNMTSLLFLANTDEDEPLEGVPSTLPPVDTPQDVPKEAVQPWEANIRLPRSVVPMHYDLYLHPDMQAGLFQGKLCFLRYIYYSI